MEQGFFDLWDGMTEEERRSYAEKLNDEEKKRLLRLLENRDSAPIEKAKQTSQGPLVGTEAHAAKMISMGAAPGLNEPEERGVVSDVAHKALLDPSMATTGGVMRDLGGLAALAPRVIEAALKTNPVNPVDSGLALFDPSPVTKALGKPGEAIHKKGKEIYHRAIDDATEAQEYQSPIFKRHLGSLNPASLYAVTAGSAGEAFWDVMLPSASVAGLKGVSRGMKFLPESKITRKIGSLADNLARDIKDFTPQGQLPENVFQRRLQAGKATEKFLHDAHIQVRELEKGIKTWAKESGLKGRKRKREIKWMRDRIDAALHTRNGVEELPETVREAARPLRETIDKMSKTIVHGQLESGEFIADRGLRSIVQKHFGEYMHESYKGFEDPSWGRWLTRNKDLPESKAYEIWRNAKEYVKERFPDWGDAKVEGRLHSMLNRQIDDEVPYFSLRTDQPLPTGKAVVKKKGLTRHGSDQDLRKFFGIYEGYKTNYLKGMAHMSSFLESRRFIDEVVPLLQAQGLAHSEQVARQSDVVGQGLVSLIPGTGKDGVEAVYTTKAIADSLNFADDISNQAVYGTINALLKGNKTIWSLKTQTRNFISSLMLTWANGNFVTPFTKHGRKIFSDAWDLGKYGMQLSFPKNKELKEIGDLLYKEGILNSSVDVGDFRYQRGRLSGWLEDGKILPTARELASDASSGGSRILKKAGDIPGRVYQWGDNFPKIIAYQQEFLKYKSLFLEKGLSVPLAETMAEKRAIEVVRDTMQNYNMLSPFAKTVRDVPGVGAFSSFPLESMRNFEKIIEHSIRDIRTPGLEKAGWNRLFSFITMVGAVPAAMTGVGIMATNVDYEQVEASRELLAFYDRNANLMPLGFDEETNTITLMNTSHSQYFQNISGTPLQAIISGVHSDRDAGEIASEVVRESLGGVLGPDLLVGGIIEASKRSDYLTPKENLNRAAYELGPGVLTSDLIPALRASRIPGIREYLPPQLRSGRTYEPIEEALNYMGFRVIKLKADDAGKYYLGRARMRLNRVKGILNDEKELQRSPVKIKQAREQLREAWEREAPDMIRIISAMKKLGVSESYIKNEALRALSRKEIRSLLEGRVPTVYD